MAIYNRYVGNIPGRYARRISFSPHSKQEYENNSFSASMPKNAGTPPPYSFAHENKPFCSFKNDGVGNFLKSVFPDWLDPGDLILLLLMLFLYIESEDDDFLIMLIVVGFSIFKKT